MKLRYIIGSFLSAILFAGCADESSHMNSYGNLSEDETFVLIPADGGDVVVKLNADADWKFDDIFSVDVTIDGEKKKLYYPLPVKLNKEKTEGELSWLSVDKLAGPAGETTLTFHADAVSGGRETDLRLSVGSKKQFIKVRQGSLEASDATVAEVLAGVPGKSYRVTGVVTGWYGNYEQYGNFYITDATGTILVYGAADKDGKLKNYPIKSWGIELGDEVTVEGGTTLYHEVMQFADVTILNVKKSLVSLSENELTIAKEGGEFSVKAAFKGNGVNLSIPAEAQSWLRMTSSKFVAGVKTIYDPSPADTTIFTFYANPNEAESREAQIDFSSSNSESSSSVKFTVKQEGIPNPPTGDGTKEDPYNVTAVLQYVKTLGNNVESDKDIYVKGKISSIKYTYSAQFGTATYNISADGKENDVFTVYGSYFFDNKPWEEGQTQIALGDDVIVSGKVINFEKDGKVTPEFSNKKNWLVSLNGKTSEGAATSIETDFTQGVGQWIINNVKPLPDGLSFVWKQDATYGMKASAFVNPNRFETDSWLVSPELKLVNGATLTMSHVQRYGSGSDLHVMMSTTHTGETIDPSQWTELTISQWPDGTSWTFIESTATIPASSKIYIAFRYTSTTSTSATWEIKTVSVK